MNNESVAILCFYSVNEVMKFIGNNEREVTLRLNIYVCKCFILIIKYYQIIKILFLHMLNCHYEFKLIEKKYIHHYCE